MYNKLKDLWETKGFEILLVTCVVVILLIALFRIGKKGSWSTSYYNPVGIVTKRKHNKESSGELECRRVLQKIFGEPFNKARPDFLRNTVTGGNFNLELDCYCERLRLGCEYQGVQHYKYVPYFHKNREAFLNGKYRDEMKKRLCKDNGVNFTIKLWIIQ